MSLEAMAAVLCARIDTKPDTKEGDGIAKAVLLAISNHTKVDGRTFPGMKRLCIYTGFSDSAVRHAIKRLEENGWLRVLRRKDPSNPQLNLPNQYFLNLAKIKEAYDTRLDEGVGSEERTNLNKEEERASYSVSQRVGSQRTHPLDEQSKMEDARAFDEDWQPKTATIQKISTEEGLGSAEIERERRLFILRSMAGTIPDKPDAAFRAWCARVKTLNHKPTAPPASAPGPLKVWDRAAKLASYRSTIELYRKMGREEEITRLEDLIKEIENDNAGTANGHPLLAAGQAPSG